jgi:hypothetical protein
MTLLNSSIVIRLSMISRSFKDSFIRLFDFCLFAKHVLVMSLFTLYSGLDPVTWPSFVLFLPIIIATVLQVLPYL